MIIEVWSDVACPWCYIGKRRFERALAGFDGADDVEVTWRSFQLDPSIPRGSRTSHDESLAKKFGVSAEQVRAMNDRVVGLAADEGLEYHFERYITVNTLDAHRMSHLARTQGLGPEMHERLFRAQFVEGAVLDDPDTLVRLATEVGVTEDAARQVAEGDAYTADVAGDIREARMLGVSGVPFFAIDRRFGISGAQPTELFASALDQAREAATQPADGGILPIVALVILLILFVVIAFGIGRTFSWRDYQRAYAEIHHDVPPFGVWSQGRPPSGCGGGPPPRDRLDLRGPRGARGLRVIVNLFPL